MITKCHLFILWSVLLLGLLNAATITHESPLTRRRKVLKLVSPKSGASKPPPIEIRESIHPSPLPEVTFQSPRPPSSTPVPPGGPELQADFAPLPDVSVTCSTSDFVVRVRPAFYGLGAEADELKLGSSCRSTGLLRPYGDMLFTYPLTACDGVRELPHGYLVYKFVLHYEPSPKRFPSRAHRISVDIECRYPRDHHVHQLAVQPTWQTVVVRKRLKGRPNDFQIKLMDDSWSGPAVSQVYQLGQPVNIQVSATHLSPGGKLYINNCYAAPSSGYKSSLKYVIIDNYGCMLDSRRDPGASQFVSRTQKTLRLSLKAFQFTADPDTEVSIHCKLFVTSEDPSNAHKSCTYKGNRWRALTGDDSICECCESRCVTSKSRRAMMEGSANSLPLLVSDQPYIAEDSFLPISTRRGDKTNMNHYIDELHSHEKLWENADDDGEEKEEEQLEESGIVLGAQTEPDLDKLSFRVGVLEDEWDESDLKNLSEFAEGGSAYEDGDFSESEVEDRFEGSKDEISDVEQMSHVNPKEGENTHPRVKLEQMFPSAITRQRGIQPSHSEDGEDSRIQRGGGEEDGRMIASEVQWKNNSGLVDAVDDGEITWYFTWR